MEEDFRSQLGGSQIVVGSRAQISAAFFNHSDPSDHSDHSDEIIRLGEVSDFNSDHFKFPMGGDPAGGGIQISAEGSQIVAGKKNSI